MSRKLKLARRARAILLQVESDLNEIWLPAKELGTPAPIVAVDWSEIFAFATRLLPNQASISTSSQRDAGALHHASLEYLFYKTPCELILLPPYFWEMRNYLDSLGREAKSHGFREKSRALGTRYSDLLAELKKIGQQDPTLYDLRDASDEQLQRLRPKPILLQLLRRVVQEYLPAIFFDLQQETLAFLDTIRSLVIGSSGQGRRIKTLQEFDPDLVKACETALDNWSYWLPYMENERPNSDRANEIDSYALAYMEQLHQHLFLRGHRLLFATRSAAMFKVMGYHPGCFPASTISYFDNGLSSFSSARSWEYFAEIGYYLGTSPAQGRTAQIPDRKLMLEKLVEGLARPGSPQRQAELFKDFEHAGLEWGNVRVAFGLEGLAEQPQWQAFQSRDDQLLVGIVRALLSENQPRAFLEQRTDVARDILEKIDDILRNFPTNPAKGSVSRETGPHLMVEFIALLRPRENLVLFIGEHWAEEVCELLTLLQKKAAELPDRAIEFLKQTSNLDSNYQHGQDVWLLALGFYCLGDFREARHFFENWLILRGSEVGPGLRLLTCSLISDAAVSKGKHRSAFEALQRMWKAKRELTPDSLITLHIVRGQTVIDWLERYGERDDDFPYDEDGRIAERTFSQFLVDFQRNEPPTGELRRAAVSILLYGIARCLHEEDFPRWALDTHSYLNHLRDDLASWCDEDPRARDLDRLGYFYFKASYIDGDQSSITQAIYHLDRAEREAQRVDDHQISNLVAKHQQLAKDRLELPFER